jgi:hypothetical protein
MFVILPPVIFVIFWANTSVGPKPLSMSLLAIVAMASVATAATIAIASRNTFVFITNL